MAARVLIVSDQADERARAASVLELRDGLTVDHAATVREAATLVADNDYDALVVDADLTPKGGTSWLYELHGQDELAGRDHVPSVLLTQRPQDAFIADWSGATVVLPKPVDGFLVARTVDGLLGD